MTHKKYRIKSRLRFTVFLIIIILGISTLVSAILGTYDASGYTAKTYQEISISNGDTLWSIAEEYMPTNMDIRKSVYKLCQLNDITADTLIAGSTLLIPEYEDSSSY